MRSISCAMFLCLALGQPIAAQPVDEVATAAIKAATTEDRFLPDWVANLPESATVPSPRDVLGYTVGTAGQLTHVDDIHRYFRELAAASPNVTIRSLGKSFEGRDMLVAVIANPETLARIEEYKDFNRQLADARKTDALAAKGIIEEAKPIYWMTAGLHSTELGPPEMVMELAYRLAVDESPLFQKIRNEVIVMITPVLEVDGRARQVEWTKRHLQNVTNYDDSPPASPPFWGHYSFHDNNRDGLTFSQNLTQNYVDAFYDWRPILSLDLHESVPLLYVSTGTGPYNEAVDPITVTEWQSIANYEVSRLTAKGLPGVWTWGFYTGWFPGYLLWVTNNHNTNGRFYETFGNHSANTMQRDLTHASYAGAKITEKTWYRSLPPERKFLWSMRNNTNFMETGTIASLEMVANNPKMFLENFYQKSVNGLTRGIAKAPYAFVIPREQVDLNAADTLVAMLTKHGIEMQQAIESFDLGDDSRINKNDIVILLNQPYGPLAKNLLEKQNFPSDVELPPYDDIAWTLGLQLGVATIPVADKKVLDIKTKELASDIFSSQQTVKGKGRYLVVNHQGQNELGPLRFALGKTQVLAAEGPFSIGKKDFNAGSFIIDNQAADADFIKKALRSHELNATATDKLPKVSTHELDLPRVAILQSWTATQNAGWVRFTLDKSEIPYQLISKDRVRAGSLGDDFDVIVMPSLWGNANIGDIIAGIDEKWSPLAYTNTPETPSHGHIDSSEDITGGIGFVGMEAIEQFIKQGGTFIGLSDGGAIAADSGITTNISYQVGQGVNTPGSILTTKILQQNPLTSGYSEWTHVFRGNGPLYGVRDYDRNLVMMQFGSKVVPEPDGEDVNDKDKETPPDLVLSGAILSGKDSVDGSPALLHTPVGKGNVVLFAWNPLHRYINHHDHAFFYNALLNWNDLPDPGNAK